MTWFGLGAQVDARISRYIDNVVTGGGGVAAHASTHISAGTDEVDGDQLDIDWNPTNYTPGTTPAEVTSVDHLTAHLFGIDQQLLASGTSFPGAPANNDLFFHTTYDELFVYSTTSVTWLSSERMTLFGRGGTGLNNTYLRCGDAIGTADRGWRTWDDLFITDMTASWKTQSQAPGKFEIQRDGAVVASHTLGAPQENFHTQINAAFAGTAQMQVFLNGHPFGLNHVNCAVFWRRSET